MRKHLNFVARALGFIVFALVLIGLGADAGTTLSLAMAPPVTFADLTFEDGQDNMGGTQLIAYYAPEADILSMPGYAAVPATLADYGTLSGNITCKPGKYFKQLYATPDTGKIDDNKIEGNDSNGFESIYEFFFPKQSAESIGFQRIAGTTKFVVVVLENDGNKRVLGSKPKQPAVLASVAGTTDVASGGGKGATFQFRSRQNGPAPVLDGTIPIDGSTSV